MTEEQFQQMLADREAETRPTPWQYVDAQSPDGQEWLGCGVMDGNQREFIWLEDRAEADIPLASRIARLPDLEAEVIRLRDLVQRATDLIEGDLVDAEWKRECRAFVRDAKGDD